MAAKDLMAAAGVLYLLSLVRITNSFVSVAPEALGAVGAPRPWIVASGPAGAADASLLQMGLRTAAVALAMGAAASRLGAARPRGGRSQAASRVVACARAERLSVDPNTIMLNKTGITAPINAVICYCEALALIAEKSGEQVQVAEDVMALNELFNDDSFEATLCNVMDSSSYSLEEGSVAKMTCDMLKPKSKAIPKFLEMVAKKGRYEMVRDITRGYIELVYTEARLEVVRCVSAQPLSDEQREKVIEAMKKRTNSVTIKLITEVDGSLGAGLKLNWKFLDTQTLSQPQETLNFSLSSKVKKMAAGQGVMLEGLDAVSLAEDLALV